MRYYYRKLSGRLVDRIALRACTQLRLTLILLTIRTLNYDAFTLCQSDELNVLNQRCR